MKGKGAELFFAGKKNNTYMLHMHLHMSLGLIPLNIAVSHPATENVLIKHKRITKY